MSLNPGIYYVQKGELGFLCDSEWDGDSFTENPHYAIKRSEPWFDGGRMGGSPYECVKVRLYFDIIPTHGKPKMISFESVKGGNLKTRFRCECSRCKRSTKSYAVQMNAVEAWNDMDQDCILEKWDFI